MAKRSSVEFSVKIEPLFRKYTSIFGVKNTCSLGVILLDRLDPREREELIRMIGSPDCDLIEIDEYITESENRNSDAIQIIKKAQKKLKRK